MLGRLFSKLLWAPHQGSADAIFGTVDDHDLGGAAAGFAESNPDLQFGEIWDRTLFLFRDFFFPHHLRMRVLFIGSVAHSLTCDPFPICGNAVLYALFTFEVVNIFMHCTPLLLSFRVIVTLVTLLCLCGCSRASPKYMFLLSRF
jgi:hypothetical protein